MSGKFALLLCALLPIAYRRCPMNNVHTRSDIICECCKGNEFKFVNGKWVPLKYAPLEENSRHSGLSMSGQLTSSDLWIGTLKQGLIIAIVFGIILSIGLWSIKNAANIAVQNRPQHTNEQ